VAATSARGTSPRRQPGACVCLFHRTRSLARPCRSSSHLTATSLTLTVGPLLRGALSPPHRRHGPIGRVGKRPPPPDAPEHDGALVRSTPAPRPPTGPDADRCLPDLVTPSVN
jgi:hypothetical protein